MDPELKQRYEKLNTMVVVQRKPFDDLMRTLEEQTSWLESQASTRFHLCEPCGLLCHSVGVAEALL